MTLSINQSHYALYVIQIQLLLLSAVGSERERGGPSIDMFIANSAVCTVWDSLYCHRGQIASASSECQLHERTQFAGTRCRRFLKPAGTLLYCGRPQTLKAPSPCPPSSWFCLRPLLSIPSCGRPLWTIPFISECI